MHLSPQKQQEFSVVPGVPTSWTHTETMETVVYESEENGKNEPWNQDYLHGLFDDQQALMDENILEHKVNMENIDDQLSAGFRALGRLKLGLRPAPKASALGLTSAPKRAAVKPEQKKNKPTKSGSSKASGKVTKKKESWLPRQMQWRKRRRILRRITLRRRALTRIPWMRSSKRSFTLYLNSISSFQRWTSLSNKNDLQSNWFPWFFWLEVYSTGWKLAKNDGATGKALAAAGCDARREYFGINIGPSHKLISIISLSYTPPSDSSNVQSWPSKVHLEEWIWYGHMGSEVSLDANKCIQVSMQPWGVGCSLRKIASSG